MLEFVQQVIFTKSPQSDYFVLFPQVHFGGEKRLDDLVDTSPDNMQLSALKQLRQEMEQLQLSWQLDGYGLFVYCVELRRLHLQELAIPALCEAVRLKPAHWGAWLELSCLVSSRDRLTGRDLPDHWCKQVFLAHTYLELQQNEQAVKIYDGLSAVGLGESTYIMAQV